MEEENIITINHVSLWYEMGKPTEIQALKDVTLSIKRGDYVSFFGPSGCGKTTMLYAISGIDHYQQGDVTIHGKSITGFSESELAIMRQSEIGIVFQQFNLLPSLNVLQNVALPMLFLGVQMEDAMENAKKLLDRLSLSSYAERYPFELSGGQQQRVGIARALANDPPIIIADEPLGNLDSTNAQNVLELLKELNEKDGRTIIMVTHEAWSLRDVKTVFYMKDGVVTGAEHTTSTSLVESITHHLSHQLSGGREQEVPEESLSSRVLSHFFLRGFALSEIEAFQKILEDRLTNKITINEFYDKINAPRTEGGIGLWKQKAKRIAKSVERIMKRRHHIEDILHELKEHPEISVYDEVSLIRRTLLSRLEDPFVLSQEQMQALDQAISDRVRGYMSHDDFVHILSLKSSLSGLGLSAHRAISIAEKLDVFLSEDAEPETYE